MIGIPTVLATRDDVLNAYQYAQASNSAEQKRQFRERLIALKNTRYMKILMDGAPTDPKKQTQDDFEDAFDPASPFAQCGLIEGEIDQMIGALHA